MPRLRIDTNPTSASVRRWCEHVDWPGPEPAGRHGEHAPSDVVRSRAFAFLIASLAAATFAAFAVVVDQVPLFLERGLTTSTAAWALGLGGVGQVC